MQHTLHFNSQFCSSKSFLLQSPLCNLNITYFQTRVLLSKTSICQSFDLHSLSNQTQIQNIVVCARKRKRVSGYQRLRTILPQLLSFLASNSQILPEPLSLAIAEFGGENGGGLGFLKGLKWGNLDVGRRKKKINFGSYGFLVITSLLVLFFGKEFRSEVVIVGVLVLGSFGALSIRKYKRRVKDFVLGIFFVVALVVLGLRREEIQKCVQRITVSSPILNLVKKPGRRNGRRLF